jgi:hypothetical protein
MMRGLAHTTGADLDDIKQEAWLLAATMPRGRGDFVARWLAAVRCHAAAQRLGVTVRPSARRAADEEYIGTGWLAGNSDDDPCAALQAAQTVARAIGGERGDDDARWQRIRQEIDLPRTAAEIAGATGCSARHGRRLAAELRELERVQADLFSADESGEDE